MFFSQPRTSILPKTTAKIRLLNRQTRLLQHFPKLARRTFPGLKCVLKRKMSFCEHGLASLEAFFQETFLPVVRLGQTARAAWLSADSTQNPGPVPWSGPTWSGLPKMAVSLPTTAGVLQRLAHRWDPTWTVATGKFARVPGNLQRTF
jgi:hypothetical protein